MKDYPASVKFLAISLAKRRHVGTKYILYPPPARVLNKKKTLQCIERYVSNVLKVIRMFLFLYFRFGKHCEKSKFAEFFGVWCLLAQCWNLFTNLVWLLLFCSGYGLWILNISFDVALLWCFTLILFCSLLFVFSSMVGRIWSLCCVLDSSYT